MSTQYRANKNQNKRMQKRKTIAGSQPRKDSDQEKERGLKEGGARGAPLTETAYSDQWGASKIHFSPGKRKKTKKPRGLQGRRRFSAEKSPPLSLWCHPAAAPCG